MQVPVRWLKSYVDTDLNADEIAARLTMAGLEAEKITRIGEHWDNVYVGLVESIEPHPDADRLVLPHIVAGEHELTVVTGAPNIEVGQKVALALAGAELIDAYADEPTRKKLKPTKIRGVRSEGMVCSEKELGLSDEHEGILVLEDDAPVGTPFREWYGDDVIEFEITPNRVDAFSIIGIARDLAAIIEQSYSYPTLGCTSTLERADDNVTIEAPDHCGRFTYTLIENVTIAPSPAWMQRRLQAAGMRPINNYVDMSNYIMLEIGHPTHPFDADLLASEEIIVRLAKAGEEIETIDHVQRELDDQTLVIADRDKALAVAGIMGGVGTEVSDTTTRVLLESAWFYPTSIRRSTRALKLNSDASARFARDIDPNGAEIAARRFIELVSEIDPGAKATRFADQFLNKRGPRQVELEFDQIERLLGMTIPLERCLEILERLELEPSTEHFESGVVITAEVPAFRNDITQAADLIEEIVRIEGYDQLPEALIGGTAALIRREPARLVDQVTQDSLIETGLQQIQTYTMINEDDLVALDPAGQSIPEILGAFPRPETDYVRAANPLRSDWELMRTTLLPSVLKIAAENLKFSERVAIFETARTYQPPATKDELPDERRTLAIVMTGARHQLDIHDPEPGEIDYFDVKGTIEALLTRLGATDHRFVAVQHPSLHPGRSAAIEVDEIQIGVLGELHPSVAQRFGIDSRAAVAELDLTSFAPTLLENWRVSPVGRYQPIRQDFAVVVDEAVSAAEVRAALESATRPLASDIRLFDVYRGSGVPEGEKSLAFRITFAAPDREISDHEREQLRKRIERTLKKQVGGSLRT